MISEDVTRLVLDSVDFVLVMPDFNQVMEVLVVSVPIFSY